MREVPVTDDPRYPRSELNRVETFSVRWVAKSGRFYVNSRPTRLAAQALAARARERGGTSIQILRQWCGGYL